MANWSQGSALIVRGRGEGEEGVGVNWTCGGGAAVRKRVKGAERGRMTSGEEWKTALGPAPEK